MTKKSHPWFFAGIDNDERIEAFFRFTFFISLFL